MKKIKKIIIFGGAGFLGQHLIQALLDTFPGVKIKVLDLKPNPYPYYNFKNNKDISFLYGRDITRPETYGDDLALNRDTDCLINLAGYISFWPGDRERMFAVNVTGIRLLVQNILKAGIPKIIHISSVASIGYNNDPDQPIDENYKMHWDKKHQKKYYMYTKYLGEQEALKTVGRKLKAVVINPGVLYGPGDLQTTYNLFSNLLKQKIPFLPSGGTGVVDVRDAAFGIAAACQYGWSGQRYILVGENQKVADTFRIAASALQVKGPDKFVPLVLKYFFRVLVFFIERFSVKRPFITLDQYNFGFLFRYYSSEKAKKELHWKPQYKMEKSMQDAVKWYKENKLLNI